MAVARAGHCELDALRWTGRNETAPNFDGDNKAGFICMDCLELGFLS